HVTLLAASTYQYGYSWLLACDVTNRCDSDARLFRLLCVPPHLQDRAVPAVVAVLYAFQFFFFSSRRRHTRCYRDWSSDVCSSDLGPPVGPSHRLQGPHRELGVGDSGRDARAHREHRRHVDVDDDRRPREHHRGEPRSEERRVGKEWRGGWSEE